MQRENQHAATAATSLANQARPLEVSRRSMIFGGTTLLAAGLLSGIGARPLLAATAAHRFKVGAAEIIVLSDGRFSLPKSFVLPDRADAELAALFEKAGAKLDLVAETNVTIVKTGPHVVLIDTGAGPDFMPTLGKLADNLDAAGIKAAEVTHVVFTHAHADHFWGVVDPLTESSLFEGARHVMTTVERDFWLKPGIETTVPEAHKTMAVGITRRMKQLGDKIETVKPNAEIVPGIALLDTPGHTPGHASVVVRSGSEEVVVLGDALTQHIVSFATPGWRWGPDIDADAAIATRRRLLDRLATSKARVVGYHLPWPGVGRVEAKDGAFRFVAG